MLKKLMMFGVLFVGAQNYVPLQWNEQQQNSQPHASESQPYPPLIVTSEIDKENAANAERYAYYKAHPKEYLKAALAPANASNWVLTVLGLVAAGIGLLTIVAIKGQSDIQAASLKQWVDVEAIDANSSPLFDGDVPLESAKVWLTFKASNNTSLPLTLRRVESEVRNPDGTFQPSIVSDDVVLAPHSSDKSGGYTFFATAALTGKEYVELFSKKNAFFRVSMKIKFSPALRQRKLETQQLHFYLCTGPEWVVAVDAVGIPDTRHKQS
jgi:hypothetical protein